MKIQTERFGEIEFKDENIITFLGGIIGFEENYRFVIIDFQQESQFKWLQSVNNPNLAFVVCDPWYFFSSYSPVIDDDTLKELEIESQEDVLVLAIATIPNNIAETTVNLLSPLVINFKKRIGKQTILYESDYSTKEKIVLKIKIEDVGQKEELIKKLEEKISQ